MRWTYVMIAVIALSFSTCCKRPRPPVTPPVVTDQVAGPVQMVNDLAGLRFERLGNPVLRWDHLPPLSAPAERPHKLLVIMVEFADRGFDRFAGEADQGDKLAAWYQELLFDDKYQRVDTLSHYYRTQSLGAYHLVGQVLPPIRLSQPRAAYGSPSRPAGGGWRNDTDPEGMVEEALTLAGKQHGDVTWADFDRWDPKDFDGDGVYDEPDGYLDHFVLVFAGGGQASCQRLNKIAEVLTPNVGTEAFAELDARQRDCVDRLWPHRFSVQKREGQGPTIAGTVNRLGGAPLNANMWIRDYNMQSEYIGPATFIHEFAHSIGLPDIYSRTSSNSTGGWDVMSATAEPSPQNLSAWSRLMLGWLKPEVITPPDFGGAAAGSIYLGDLDAAADGSNPRAAMVVLPPKQRKIDLGGLPVSSGQAALYSGQGNELNRRAELSVDLSGASGALELAFDAWWEIEAGWDFAYLETSIDGGKSWRRRVPGDRKFMPAKHGHDGKASVPGFTGLSGDYDGDNKNESNSACDPKVKLAHGEDQATAAKSPCLTPSWVKPRFDISDLAGKKALIRWRYFTDGAAVMRGLMIDNVTVTGVAIAGDFESEIAAPWQVDGFSLSPGHHDILVPHFYLLEYRDPYIGMSPEQYRYDSALAQSSPIFYYDVAGKRMRAVSVSSRRGVVVWYFNGAYAWSENDPAINGPGKGYLLAVDSHPHEISLPGFTNWLEGSPERADTRYEIQGADAQTALRTAYFETVCFVRNPSYLPKGGVAADYTPSVAPECGKSPAPVGAITVDGQKLIYGYQLNNDYLPGEARDPFRKAGELVDTKTRDGKTTYRMRDVSLRYMHTQDSPFWYEPFAEGTTHYDVTATGLVVNATYPHPAQPRFDDTATPMNVKLPFGNVDLPKAGFAFEVAAPGADAPAGVRVKVSFEWGKPAAAAPAQ